MVKMNLVLADEIPVSFITPYVRAEIAKHLDVVDNLNGQRDYIGLGTHLLDEDEQTIKALRANNNGVSITGVILDNAAKRDISIKKLYDTLKTLDVHGRKEIERDWEQIVARYNHRTDRYNQTSNSGTENLDSMQSRCCCEICKIIPADIPNENHNSITNISTSVHLNNLNLNGPLFSPENKQPMSYVSDLNSGEFDFRHCDASLRKMCRNSTAENGSAPQTVVSDQTVMKTPLNSTAENGLPRQSAVSDQTVIKTPLNSTAENGLPPQSNVSDQTVIKTPVLLAVQSVLPQKVYSTDSWLPPSSVSSDSHSCNSCVTQSSYSVQSESATTRNQHQSRPYHHNNEMRQSSGMQSYLPPNASCNGSHCCCQESPMPCPGSPMPNRQFTMPYSRSPMHCPESTILNLVSTIPNPESTIPNPESTIPFMVSPTSYTATASPYPSICLLYASQANSAVGQPCHQCSQCNRNTGPPGLIEYLLVKNPVTRNAHSCNIPLQTHANQKIQIQLNDKVPFVYITCGQRENGRRVHKLVMRFIAQLEEHHISVVADLPKELYISQTLMDGPAWEMESLEAVSKYLLNKASCVIMGITPGYFDFVKGANSDQSQSDAVGYQQRVAYAYTLMYMEFEKNQHRHHRLFPVKLRSEAVPTEDKHIPDWVRSALCYLFDRHKKNTDLINHLKQFLTPQVDP